MNNCVAETNTRVAVSAPTDKGQICVEIQCKRGKQAYSWLSSHKNKASSVFLSNPLNSCLFTQRAQMFTTYVSGICTQISCCFLDDSLFNLAMSLCSQKVWLSVSAGLPGVHVRGLRTSCFLWHPCHFLLDILALASCWLGDSLHSSVNVWSLRVWFCVFHLTIPREIKPPLHFKNVSN